MSGTCSIDGCGKAVTGLGLCSMHYWRVRTYGDVHHERKPHVASCSDCGAKFETIYVRKKYCDECGAKRRGGKHILAAPGRRQAVSDTVQHLAQTAGRQETALTDVLGHPEAAWSVLYSVPFDAAVSKNRRWSNNGKGAVFLTKSVRAYQDAVIALTRAALRGRRVAQNKLWLSFLVEKPNNRFDAINVVDTLCDAIKVAAGLDDRWFCIGKIDWVIRKTDPSILIKISQETTEDAIVCAHCGELKSPEEFTRHRRNPLGRARACRSCKSQIDRAARDSAREKVESCQ